MRHKPTTTLKIGAFTFSVTYLPNLTSDDNKKIDGHLWHSKAIIEIDKDLERQPKTQTLLHEIVHEIAIQAGQDLTEGQVDALAFGWYQVMRDNPELVRMIRK